MLLEISDVLEGLKEADRIKTDSSPSIGTWSGQEKKDVCMVHITYISAHKVGLGN